MSKIIIAIDGYSSTGKSTIAKQLAQTLNYIYIDTGAMYRAMALYALRHDLITKEKLFTVELIAALDKIDLRFEFNPNLGFSEMYLNGENVESEIRTMYVSDFVSRVAKIPEIRVAMVEKQREWGKEKGLVMDGRDIGTVVFPKAELKLFMTASAKVRAERRYEELKNKDEEITFEEVLKNVTERDQMDSTRKNSPLKKAEDAVEIDNSNLSRDEQFKRILDLVKTRISKA